MELRSTDPTTFNRIFGEGLYTNDKIAKLVSQENQLRIEPIPIPVASLLAHNVLFVLFFFGFWLAVDRLGGDSVEAAIACTLVGLLTCVAFTAITVWQHSNAMRLGPWLIVDRSAQTAELPRHDKTVPLQEVAYLQYITTLRPERFRSGNRRHLTEVNLVVHDDNELIRYSMLRSILGNGYDELVKNIAEHDVFEVRRVKETFFSGSINESSLAKKSHVRSDVS